MLNPINENRLLPNSWNVRFFHGDGRIVWAKCKARIWIVSIAYELAGCHLQNAHSTCFYCWSNWNFELHFELFFFNKKNWNITKIETNMKIVAECEWSFPWWNQLQCTIDAILLNISIGIYQLWWNQYPDHFRRFFWDSLFFHANWAAVSAHIGKLFFFFSEFRIKTLNSQTSFSMKHMKCAFISKMNWMAINRKSWGSS